MSSRVDTGGTLAVYLRSMLLRALMACGERQGFFGSDEQATDFMLGTLSSDLTSHGSQFVPISLMVATTGYDVGVRTRHWTASWKRLADGYRRAVVTLPRTTLIWERRQDWQRIFGEVGSFGEDWGFWASHETGADDFEKTGLGVSGWVTQDTFFEVEGTKESQRSAEYLMLSGRLNHDGERGQIVAQGVLERWNDFWETSAELQLSLPAPWGIPAQVGFAGSDSRDSDGSWSSSGEGQVDVPFDLGGHEAELSLARGEARDSDGGRTVWEKAGLGLPLEMGRRDGSASLSGQRRWNDTGARSASVAAELGLPVNFANQDGDLSLSGRRAWNSAGLRTTSLGAALDVPVRLGGGQGDLSFEGEGSWSNRAPPEMTFQLTLKLEF